MTANDISVESAAYHEAGHIVIAVAMGISIRRGGMCIDQVGNGVAYYGEWTVDWIVANTDSERQLAIVVADAGLMAQKDFHSACSDPRGEGDEEQVKHLLEEMACKSDLEDLRLRLRGQAREKVTEHKKSIEILAQELLKKPWCKPALATQRSWSNQPHKKCLCRSEITAILANRGLQVIQGSD